MAQRLFLYDFFQEVRTKSNMDLDLNQYYDFLQLWKAGYAISKDDLFQLVKTLWLSFPAYEDQFEKQFDNHFKDYTKEVNRIIQLKSVLKSEAEITPNPIVDNKNVQKEENENIKETHKKDPVVEPKEKIVDPPSKEPSASSLTPSDENTSYGKGFLSFEEGNATHSGDYQPEPWRNKADLKDHPFIFSDKHLPFNARKLEQRFRRLRNQVTYTTSDELDIMKMIEQRFTEGAIATPVFQRKKVYHQSILLLIDHDGTMVAFEGLANFLKEVMQSSFTKVEVYYFKKIPIQVDQDYRVSSIPLRPTDISLQKIVNRMDQKHTTTIIFSDGGAAKNQGNSKMARSIQQRRTQSTIEFLQYIQRLTAKMVWLNPVPKQRWSKHATAYIQYFIKMIEANNEDISELIKFMKQR